MKFGQITRIQNWKNYLIPFLLGFVFLPEYIYKIPFNQSLVFISAFLIMIVATAAYGFLLNDIFDAADDVRSGKLNYSEHLTSAAKTVYIFLFLVLTLLPWLLLPLDYLNFSLFILQLLLLALYSIPPIRLKKYPVIGVITDALYNSVIMVFVIIFTIHENDGILTPKNEIILAVLFIALFLKGLRGILLHQIADRKNDQKAGVKTFMLKYGAFATTNLINRVLIPFELFGLFILSILFSEYTPGLLWVFLAFLFYKALKLRFWNIRAIIIRHHGRPLRFMFLYILNDFYEEWFPLYMLVLLTARDVNFAFILIAYVVLFQAIFKKLIRDIPETIANFRGDFKKKFYGKN